MAKCPKVDQIDQLISDLTVTAQRSDFPSVRHAAKELLLTTEKFRSQLAAYYKLTD